MMQVSSEFGDMATLVVMVLPQSNWLIFVGICGGTRIAGPDMGATEGSSFYTAFVACVGVSDY